MVQKNLSSVGSRSNWWRWGCVPTQHHLNIVAENSLENPTFVIRSWSISSVHGRKEAVVEQGGWWQLGFLLLPLGLAMLIYFVSSPSRLIPNHWNCLISLIVDGDTPHRGRPHSRKQLNLDQTIGPRIHLVELDLRTSPPSPTIWFCKCNMCCNFDR